MRICYEEITQVGLRRHPVIRHIDISAMKLYTGVTKSYQGRGKSMCEDTESGTFQSSREQHTGRDAHANAVRRVRGEVFTEVVRGWMVMSATEQKWL